MTRRSGGLRHTALRLSGFALRQAQRLHARLERSHVSPSERAPYMLRHAPSTADKLIVHLNGNFDVGGSSQLIVDLVELMSDAYRHEIVVPARPTPLPYQPLDLHAVPVTEMERLRQYLMEKKPALVHLHYWSRAENMFDATGIWYAGALAICDVLDIPVVQNINVPTRPMKGRSVRRNVYVSAFVRDEFDDGGVPSEVIYPGADFSRFKAPAVPAAPNAIGMVYRLDNDKLNERSIEPFILVAKVRPATKCIIVGDGMFSALFRSRVEQERLSEQIEFAGMLSYADLPAAYERMGLFVAPVHNESFGQVSPFAMSMGLPVVGYDIGALPEILGARDTLVAPGDERALAQAIIRLIDDPALRLELGMVNARRAHDLFSREGMVAKYRALYHAVLSGTASEQDGSPYVPILG